MRKEAECRTVLIVWLIVSAVAAGINVVLWFAKPSADYLLTGFWNVAEVFPLLTAIVLPAVLLMTIIRYAAEFPVRFPICAGALLGFVMAVSVWGVLERPEWFMLPDLDASHRHSHPPVNYMLAWGAACSVCIMLICLSALVAERRRVSDRACA